MMAHPRHREGQGVFVTALRRQVEVIVRAHEQVESARVTRIRVEDLAVPVLVEDADAGGFLARELAQVEVVSHAALRLPCDDTHVKRQPMRFLNASIWWRGARDTASSVTSRCARCTAAPSIWSARKEQLGHPSSHPGPNMKWYAISWRRPSKRSASVALPSGLSNT